MFTTYIIKGKKKWQYRQEYKGRQLRKRGFATRAAAEADLRQAVHDIDNPKPEELEPTTLKVAFDLYQTELRSRAAVKGSVAYSNHITATLNILQTFLDRWNPDTLVSQIEEIHLRDWYKQYFQNERGLAQSTASTHLGKLGGMFKFVQRRRRDLATWNRPVLDKVSPRVQHGGRVVTPYEYSTLVGTLLDPPKCSHFEGRKSLWRDAADAVRLARNTGGRLNEILRLRLSHVNFKVKTVRLYGKNENEREVPLSDSCSELIRARAGEGLTGEDLVFARARTSSFDNLIESALRDAARAAKLKYGQKTPGGFTFHSFRHTFITDLVISGVDTPTAMALSGHKSLKSFQIYLHATDFGRNRAKQIINSFDACLNLEKLTGKLTASTSKTGVSGGNEGKSAEVA